jgi:gamma-glutamylcyclotransferase (GGCT)/AIG2-like uncharacterized protein YtfP
VYGTLMRGEPAHDRLRAALYLGEFRTKPGYRLLDLGDFPGLVEGGADAVLGELYAIDERTLAALDAFEDVPRSYTRTTLELPGIGVAFVYLLTPTLAADARPLGAWSWRRRPR